MRIVIDMQGLQASNAKRGIGRYTSDLVKNLLDSKENNETFLLLNGMLSEIISSICNEFGRYMLKENIVVWS
ncbi:hypothetical protein [Serratia symbiotica]|uniref:hypothetical protein n=1 Tax=Serratia symbiotica TaxID=138074 RepID=UPI0030CB0BAC|nr:glycosyltransferase family 4 protein [Serratia symbiotica]